MDVAELTSQEQVALMALIDLLILSDGEVSEGEEAHIKMLVDEMGEEDYLDALDEARAWVTDVDDLEDLLRKVKRPEAQEMILAAVLEVALDEGIDAREDELIELAARVWEIDPDMGGFEEFDDDDDDDVPVDDDDDDDDVRVVDDDDDDVFLDVDDDDDD